MDSDIPINVPVVLDTPPDIRAEKGEKPNKKKSLKLKLKLKLQPQQQHPQKPNQRKTKKVRFA
jgi:hypothetical protein